MNSIPQEQHSRRAAEFALEFKLAQESPPYLEAVETWRRVWKPRDQDVRIVLLAESHVAEQVEFGDAETIVRLPATLRDLLGTHWPADLPERYVRLVYCLGYGEPEVCRGPLTGTHNQGTWQYWDLFGAVAHERVEATQPRRSATRGNDGLRIRLQWKLEVLQRLRSSGIWLIDTSPVALYVPGGNRVASGTAYRNVIQQAFLRFVVPQLERFTGLEQLWVIGRDMGAALGRRGTDKWIRADRIISQPQDRNVSRYREDLARMVYATATRGAGAA